MNFDVEPFVAAQLVALARSEGARQVADALVDASDDVDPLDAIAAAVFTPVVVEVLRVHHPDDDARLVDKQEERFWDKNKATEVHPLVVLAAVGSIGLGPDLFSG